MTQFMPKTNHIIKTEFNTQTLLLSSSDTKDESHRLRLYIDWMTENNLAWYAPDLETYRDYLLRIYSGRDDQPLHPVSVKSHLSTIRGRYKAILRKNSTRDYLYDLVQSDLSASDKKAFVDEMIERIKNAIDPENSSVKLVSRQDIDDETHLRLTKQQVSHLLAQPDKSSLIGKRDLALLALMLCTGIREAELCALDVNDLYRKFGGEPALLIRQGKGAKQRLIPYGNLIWGLNIVESWLASADISTGAVFYGFFRGGKRIRPDQLTVRAVNQILDKYPIVIDGQLRKVAPHDLRRTYARQLYESGMDLLAIRDNLGHADSRTTLKYIGTMDVTARMPEDVYDLKDVDLE